MTAQLTAADSQVLTFHGRTDPLTRLLFLNSTKTLKNIILGWHVSQTLKYSSPARLRGFCYPLQFRFAQPFTTQSSIQLGVTRLPGCTLAHSSHFLEVWSPVLPRSGTRSAYKLHSHSDPQIIMPVVWTHFLRLVLQPWFKPPNQLFHFCRFPKTLFPSCYSDNPLWMVTYISSAGPFLPGPVSNLEQKNWPMARKSSFSVAAGTCCTRNNNHLINVS